MKNSFSHSPLKLFYFFLASKKLNIAGLVMLVIIMGALPSIDSLLLKKITNLIESFPDDKATALPSLLVYWAIFYGLWWEGNNYVWRIYDYLYQKTMPIIKGKVLEELYNYTQHHSHKFFQDNLAGHITNRITEGARSLELIFSNITEKVIHKVAVIVFALVTMYWVHYIFATIFFIWLCVFVGLSSYFSSTINDYSTTYSRNKSTVSGKIVDAISNISATRMFTSHDFEREYLNDHLNTTIKSEQNLQWFMLKLRYILGFSCSVMIFTIVYYLGVLRSQLLISIGDCVLIVSLCGAVADDIWDLTQEIGDLFEEIGVFNQSLSLIEPYAITDIKHAKDLKIKKGQIEFENVSFYYRNNNNIFKDQSVTIEGGQKVGLVGFSGSGKSTFVSLITRLHDIESGNIKIDGQNIKNITQDSLRRNISVIPQEPILFHRTIMENIRYGKKDATDEEIIKAAKSAHIHEFIIKLAEGYHTLCGERGNNLSGGQRQRIIIARAILKNSHILILDEATSSLDSATENLVQDSLQYLMQNKTVLVVAHRLSTLLSMDRILVFHGGCIVEDGNHEELLKNSKLYKKLWKAQFEDMGVK